MGFAKPLKELAVQVFDRPINKATDRIFLQRLGMGMRSEVLGALGYEALVSYLIGGLPSNVSPSRLERELYFYCRSARWGYGNHWIDLFDANLNSLQSDILLVEDMRFLNEYEYLCGKLGFKSIRVSCDEEVRQARVTTRDGVFDTKMDADISEREWRYIPYDLLLRTDDPDGYQESLNRYVAEATSEL